MDYLAQQYIPNADLKKINNELQRERVFMFMRSSWLLNFLIGLLLKHFTMRLYLVFGAQRGFVDKLSNSLIAHSKSEAPTSLSLDFYYFTQKFDSRESIKSLGCKSHQSTLFSFRKYLVCSYFAPQRWGFEEDSRLGLAAINFFSQNGWNQSDFRHHRAWTLW